MFSGIVEATGRVVEASLSTSGMQVAVEIPKGWEEELQLGDSVAHNGVCLTVEKVEAGKAWYTLGHETLRVTGWGESLQDATLNLERSLKLGDRVHGHLVLGHVDGKARIVDAQNEGGFLTLNVLLPPKYEALIWKKGSITLNGVSLTVNNVWDSTFQVGLIPETLRRTNLGDLRTGDYVLFEVDNLARGLLRYRELQSSPLREPGPEVIL